MDNISDAPEEKDHKKLIIFGRDVGQIPCFRASFLNGIGCGFGAAFIGFMATSKPRLATHIGFGTFMTTTMVYWFYCRYHWSKTKFEYQLLQRAMRERTLYEGTDIEREIERKGENV